MCRGFEDFTYPRGLVEIDPGSIDPGSEDTPDGGSKDFHYPQGLPLTKDGDKGAACTVRLVQEWFEKRGDNDKPFFMFINFVEPRAPVWGPQPFRKRFLLEGVQEEEALQVNQDPDLEFLGLVPNRPDGHMNERDWDILKSLYDGDTAYLDDRMGLLFDYMRRSDLLDETLLIITSDHGDMVDRKGYMAHNLALFDDLIHVPLIVRYPCLVPKGQRTEHLVQICDWLPTVICNASVGIGETPPMS